MASVAASGAYYIAAGAKKVYANAGTLTGSIGVIMEFMNLRKLYDWAKVERFSIKTGKFKDSGSESREMLPEERAYFQALVGDTLEQFKAAVGEGRKLSAEEVNAIADGRVFTGVQAKKLKMVDEIGTMDDAVDFIAKEAGIKGKPHLVRPVKRNPGLRDLLMGSGSDEDEEFSDEESEYSGSILERAVARVVDRAADRLVGEAVMGEKPRPVGIYWLWNGAR
jgi:protease-4